jgi:Rad3-related DNA helicase
MKGEQPSSDQTKQYESMDKHICKVNRFINNYDPANWVMTVTRVGEGKKATHKFEFKPVNVAPFGHDYLFKFGDVVLMMSGTILDHELFCKDLGIPLHQTAFMTVESPFAAENRPIHYLPVGKMNAKDIDATLPKMAGVIKDLLKLHADQKGIIHAHSFKVVKYLQENVKSDRLLVQNETNREEILEIHCESKEPTVLVSPSMNEGVDLRDDLSRFQVICKVPFPYIGSDLVKKRMQLDERWYPYTTAKTIMQAYGRSVRNQDDHAQTYVLDECWEDFYRQNKSLFPKSFKEALQ